MLRLLTRHFTLSARKHRPWKLDDTRQPIREWTIASRSKQNDVLKPNDAISKHEVNLS